MTRFEVAPRDTTELQALLSTAFQAAAVAPHGSTERANALASVHNFQCALAARIEG
ncbi:MAG: hypothetical protein AAF249_16175 [Pseudomonadota bacterium]